MTIRMSRAELAALGIEIDDAPVFDGEELHGPWSSGLLIAVRAPVRSKSNFRLRQMRGQRWGQVQEFEATVKAALRKQRPPSWQVEGMDVPLKKRHEIVAVCYARALLDASNLSKSVLDAAEGVLYPNDAAVRAETSIVERGRNNQLLVCGFAQNKPGEGGGLEVVLAELTTQVMAKAAAAKAAEEAAGETAEEPAEEDIRGIEGR